MRKIIMMAVAIVALVGCATTSQIKEEGVTGFSSYEPVAPAVETRLPKNLEAVKPVAPSPFVAPRATKNQEAVKPQKPAEPPWIKIPGGRFKFLPGSEHIIQAGGGLVPWVMSNPSEGLWRHGYIFWGSETVEEIPDARRINGWMFNRSAIIEFELDPASGRDWHNEVVMPPLPRGSSFTIWEQATRFGKWSVGQPNIFSFSTGSHPRATSYEGQTPSRLRYNTGAYVPLPYVDPSGVDQLRIHIDLNPGQYMKAGIYSVINGVLRAFGSRHQFAPAGGGR